MTHEYLDEEQVRKGRLMLWIALAGSIVMIPALFSGKAMVLFLVAWVASFFGGLGGIREVARGTGGSALLMYAALVAVFMPILNIVVIAAYLLRAHKALQGEAEAVPAPAPPRPRTPQPGAKPTASPAFAGSEAEKIHRASMRKPPAAAPSVHTGHALSGAIAYVKHAGIGRPADVGGEIPDGKRLHARAKLPDGTELPPEAQPLIRATHGVFAVVYFLDRGGHYSWVNAGQLAQAGIGLEELHRVGVANLQRLTTGNPGLRIHEGEGAHMLTMGGQFEASLVLVDSLWDDMLREYAPNGPVVAVPARDMCVFADSLSKDGIARVAAVATQPLADATHALTQNLFMRRGGRWQQWVAVKGGDLPPLEFK